LLHVELGYNPNRLLLIFLVALLLLFTFLDAKNNRNDGHCGMDLRKQEH